MMNRLLSLTLLFSLTCFSVGAQERPGNQNQSGQMVGINATRSLQLPDSRPDQPGEVTGKAGNPMTKDAPGGWIVVADATATRMGLDSTREYQNLADVAGVLGYDPLSVALMTGSWKPAESGVSATLTRQVSPSGEIICLAACNLPAQPELENQLIKAGARVLGFLPNNAYVLSIPADKLKAVSKLTFISWLGQLPTDKKYAPELARGNEIAPMPLAISIYDASQAEQTRADLTALGVSKLKYSIFGKVFYGHAPPSLISTITALPNVAFVERVLPAKGNTRHSVMYCGEHSLIRDYYPYDATVTVGLIDSGFQINHTAFAGQSGFPALYGVGWNVSGQGTDADTWTDPDRHGTFAGSVLASRWGSSDPLNDLVGMGPRIGGTNADTTRLRVVRCGRSDDADITLYNVDQALTLLANDNQSVVVNNSWSTNNNTGTDALSRQVDDIVWNKWQSMVFAAGNDGPNAGSIDSPAAAKNAIAVGNVANDTSWAEQSDSSRGPTADGRAKPDIYAPGRTIRAADASNLNGYMDWSGTSFSAPHVTGLIGSLIGHYDAFRRRPAMTKAYVMTTARRRSFLPERTGIANGLESHFYTENNSGSMWGSWDYSGDNDPRAYDYIYWDFNIPSGMAELYIMLTWIEPAVSAGSFYSVQDNYDLYVDFGPTYPTTWQGQFSSQSTVDNVEFVRVTNPTPGVMRLKARKINAPVPLEFGVAVLGRKATGGDDRFEPNGSAGQARAMGQGTWDELLCLHPDWYSFSVPHNQSINVSASFINFYGNLDLQLYNSNGTQLLAESITDNNTESVAWTNTSGSPQTVTARVFGRDQWTNEYSLTSSLSAVTPTNTPTASNTSTPANTMTQTPTNTLTHTVTRTFTPTRTATRTLTLTPTQVGATNTPTNTPTPTINWQNIANQADLNKDGVVNSIDLLMFMQVWQNTATPLP